MTALLAFIGLIGSAAAYAFTYFSVSELLDGQLQQIALNAGGGVRVADALPAADDDPEDVFAVAIFTHAGSPSFVSGPLLDLGPQKPGFADIPAKGEMWRVYTAGSSFPIVQIAQQRTVRVEVAQNAALTAATPVLLVIPLSWFVVGWAMNRSLRRLDLLVAEIGARGAEAGAPIDANGAPTEVVPLVESLNGLIGRLSAAVSAQKRFVADAAHELRTPLAALQIQVDVLRSPHRKDEAAAISSLAQGVLRATLMTNQLLRLARLDETTPPQLASVDVRALLTDCVAELVPLADLKGVDLGLIETTSACCLGSEVELKALFGNLIENAVKYSPAGGRVDVSLKLEGKDAVVEITDSGPGIAREAMPRIFERFFRADTLHGTGSGLGLAIVKQVADRHGFALSVANRADGSSGVRACVVMKMTAALGVAIA